MKKSKFLFLSIAIVLLISCIEKESDGIQNVPCIDVDIPLTIRADRIVTIKFDIDGNGKNNYQVADNRTSNLDSLKTYLIEGISRIPEYARHVTSANIVAARNIRMLEIESLFMELRRLGFRSFILAYNSNCSKTRFDDPLKGLITREAKLTEENLLKFYAFHDLTSKSIENILALPHNPNVPISKGPPPPKVIDNSFESYNKRAEKAFGDHKKIRIFMNQDGTYGYLNSDYDIEEARKIIAENLQGNKCLFLIKSDRETAYKSYLELYNHIRNEIYKQRDFYCLEKYEKNFRDLNREVRERVIKASPHNLIYEPLYFSDKGD